MIIKKCSFKTILIDSRCLRKGILLEITNEEGSTASSEISPLPGYSEETLEEALHQLTKLKRRILKTWWTKHTLHNLSNFGLYPSVYFGLESALLDLLEPIAEQKPISKYALLLGSPDEILQRAQESYDAGCRQAKLKLGHFPPDIAHEIIDNLGDKLRLRLDFNQKWNLKETLAFCSKYPQDHFEYIEEPASNPKNLTDFPYPFALDETLRDKSLYPPLLKCTHLKALILKPTMTYPITPFLNYGKKVVLTSSFEGPLGIAQIKKLILRHDLISTCHGLDTLRYFENGSLPSIAACEKQPV